MSSAPDTCKTRSEFREQVKDSQYLTGAEGLSQPWAQISPAFLRTVAFRSLMTSGTTEAWRRRSPAAR